MYSDSCDVADRDFLLVNVERKFSISLTDDDLLRTWQRADVPCSAVEGLPPPAIAWLRYWCLSRYPLLETAELRVNSWRCGEAPRAVEVLTEHLR